MCHVLSALFWFRLLLTLLPLPSIPLSNLSQISFLAIKCVFCTCMNKSTRWKRQFLLPQLACYIFTTRKTFLHSYIHRRKLELPCRYTESRRGDNHNTSRGVHSHVFTNTIRDQNISQLMFCICFSCVHEYPKTPSNYARCRIVDPGFMDTELCWKMLCNAYVLYNVN